MSAQRTNTAEGLFLCGVAVVFLLAAADYLGLPGGMSVGQVALLGLMPLFANAAIARRQPVFSHTGHLAAMIILGLAGALLLWALFSGTHAENILRIGRPILSLSLAFGAAAFVVGTVTEERLPTLILALALALSSLSVLSLLGYLNSSVAEYVYYGTDRSYATFKNPNQYGMVLSTTLPLIIAFAVVTSGRMQITAAVSALAMLLGLILSGSKANLLLTAANIMVLSMLMVVVYFRGQRRYLALSVVAVLGICTLAAGIWAMTILNPRAFDLLTAFLDADRSVPSLNSRQHIWAVSWEVFVANPIFGEGAGQTIQVEPDGEFFSHSHNILLDYARTLGAPGLTGMALLCGTVVGFAILSILAIVLLRPGNPGLRCLTIGAALGSINYVAANSSSESFGPSTSVFFWLVLFLFLFMHGRLFGARQRTRAQSASSGFPA